MATETTFEGYTIGITDDEWAVMPEGNEEDREGSLARYHEIAERDLAETFPGAEIVLGWGGTFAVDVERDDEPLNPEDVDEIENTVRDRLARVFENGKW